MPRRLRSLAFGLGVAVAAALVAQPIRLDARFEGGESSAKMSFESASSKVHVRAVFEGGEAVWLLLDSGANMSILDKALSDRLGLELRGGGTAQGAAGGGAFSFAFTDAPRLSFPGLDIASRPVAVIERKTQGANGHASEGLLGADLFRAFVVDVDYPNRILTLHDPESFQYSGAGVVLPVTFDANDKWEAGAVLTVGERNVNAKLIVDTGSRGTLGLTAPFVANNGLLESLPEKYLATVGVGVGGEVKHWVASLDSLQLGTITIRDLPVTLAPEGARGSYGRADRDGILGGEILERFRAIFDRSRGRLILEPPAADSAQGFDWDAAGLFLSSEGPDYGVVRVLSVSDGTPAAVAGLRIGDRIISVDGRAASDITLDGMRGLFRIPDRTYTLVLERDHRRLEIELVTRRLI